MNRKVGDSVFTGAISEIYERHLVPLIFETYAGPLSLRLVGTPLRRVLETAAGAGVVTRALAIERDLSAGGFSGAAEITTVEARSRATSPDVPAIAYCPGTPLRNEIEARESSRLADATDLAANAIAERFSSGAVEGKIQAHIVAVRR